VALARECDYALQIGNIVAVENCRPLGEINGEHLFACDKREIMCYILPKNEIRDTK
jgi:hypothetical protein